MSAGKFVYNGISVLFDRAWNNFQVEKYNSQSVTESMAGLTDTLEFYNRDLIHLERNRLTGTEVEQLRKWWEYVRDGSSFALYRDKDFGLEIDFAGKSSNTNNGNSPTFTRTGTANVIDLDTGLLTSIAANTERFPEGNFGRGLLIENIMENKIPAADRRDFDTNWVNFNCTVTQDQIDGVDGITDAADKIVSTGIVANIYLNITGEVVGTDDGTFSVYLRSLSESVAGGLTIQDDTGNQKASTAITITPEWQRFSISYDNPGPADGDDWRVVISIDASGKTIYADNAQFEIGSLYPTTYYAGTRNVETCYYNLDSNNFDNKNFSISFWFNPQWDSSEITAAYNSILWISESGSSNRLCSLLALTNYFEFLIKDYEQNTITATTATYTLSKDTWYHFVLTVDSTISNGIKIYINAVQKNTPSNDAFIPSDFERLYIGTYPSQYADGIFDNINIWKKVLNTSEITQIYNKGSAIGTTQNYWSAVKIINPNFNPIQKIGSDKWDFAVDLMQILS